jgi:hypothetical protein
MKILQGVIILTCVGLGAILVKATNDNRLLHQQVTAQKQFIEQREAVIDSLTNELFDAQCVIGRVELTLEHFNEVDPKTFIEWSRYYDHETE